MHPVSKYFFTALMLLSSSVFAEDLSSCTLKKEEDQRNYCKASFAGSGTFCDQIKNGELRRDCTFMVIRIQRENAYKIRNAKKEEPAAE
ncbi:MAG: hypothetical protein RLZZ470_1010 [Pseudomonadota bacterium]|jgi:hypothetical protein